MDQVMSIEAALAVADEVSPTPARAVTALKVLRTALLASNSGGFPVEVTLESTTDDAREVLAGRLIDAWCESHRKQIPWVTAVEIIAIVTQMPDAERVRLLGLADVSEVGNG